ncbi:MAG: nuclear transport factor 2 family protein [Xenococcaceae cyanobacterium MO_207.B15]|nr:nuclear transport factor 2 family protein [Xenococcaceae cyanobacterium MO_207.B15]
MTQVLALIVSLLIFSGQMNSKPTIQAMIKKQALAWEQEDVSSIVEDFAPNAIFIAGGYTFQGIEAIQQSAEAYFSQHRD